MELDLEGQIKSLFLPCYLDELPSRCRIIYVSKNTLSHLLMSKEQATHSKLCSITTLHFLSLTTPLRKCTVLIAFSIQCLLLFYIYYFPHYPSPFAVIQEGCIDAFCFFLRLTKAMMQAEQTFGTNICFKVESGHFLSLNQCFQGLLFKTILAEETPDPFGCPSVRYLYVIMPEKSKDKDFKDTTDP